MSRAMDDKEDKDNNNNKEQNLRESSLSSLSSSSLSILLEPSLSSTSTPTTTSTCTPFGFNRSVDSYSLNIMGRKNFKPESVSCLTESQPVPLATVNPSDDQTNNERMIKMKQFQSSSSSSSSPRTPTVKSTCTPYHPHHYHHHRLHRDHQQQMTPSNRPSSHNKHDDDKDNIPKEEVKILDTSTNRSSTSTPPQSTTLKQSCYSADSIEYDSISMRKSDNTNPLGLPDWNQNDQRSSSSSSSNINTSLIKKVSNPVGGSVTLSSHLPGSSSKVSDESSRHHDANTNSRYYYRQYHHTHLHSPRKSKKIPCSSSRWLHRSSSDPGMASSATYSTHTSALLLTTGAYSGSPSLLTSSLSPSPTQLSSSSTKTTTTLRNKSYSPFSISPTITPVTTKVITNKTTTPSSSPSPTPSCYIVPSSSSNASSTKPTTTTTTTPPPRPQFARSRQLTGSPGPSPSPPRTPPPPPPPTTTTTTCGFNKRKESPSSSSSSFHVNPSPSPPLPASVKLSSTCQSNLASSPTTSGSSSASNFFSSQMSNTKRCVLRLDGYSYLIVANPPETKVTKDAIESNRPTETIVARRGVQKTTVPSAISPWNAKDKDISSSIEDKIVTDTSSILKESTMETLPPVDTVEACDKAASRLRELAQHLDHGEVPISILKKTLQYAACVLDTVTMDETRKWRPGLVRKKGLGVRAPSDPTPSLLTKSLSICGPVPITNQSSSLSTTKPSLPSKTTTATTTIASSSLEMSSDLRSSSINKTIPTTQISRKILDEEDDLSEVQPDAVPNEVREWLASTFTRNNTAQKRRSEEKPKFRSVANAIRAGIMVDRLYRRLCCSNMVQIPPKIADKLKSIDNWSYDCFKLNEASNNQVLKYISYELLNRYGLVHKFKIPLETLESCLNQFEQGYTKFKNPYHNNIHAADVTQTVHYMLSKMGLVNWLTDLEIFATLLAAIIHDFQHTGTTNNFHVMSESETALLYNDRAVLENFHISAAFRILKENDCNILVNLNKEEYRELRTLVIDMVLATDMSSHFQQIKTMKSLLSNTNEFTVDKSKALSLVLHCCDISHPSKQWDIHRRWTELLLEEFFRQGDKERELGLPYSPLCDRNTTLVAESQIGFIDFIVAPSLEVCGDLLDKIYQQMEGCRHSSGSSEESLEERLPDNGTRPKSLSTYKNKRSGLSVDSADSQVNSRPVASAPASPRFSHCTSFGNCKAEGGRLKRPWFDNLEENRKRWQERATIDAIQREQNARKQPADGISLSMSPESEL